MRRQLRRLIVPGLLIMQAGALPALAADVVAEDATAKHQGRVTWQEHFKEANQAHDGHLTLDEAKNGYPTVAKHFQDIDADGKGYVTENDIRAWQAMRKAGHQLGKTPPDELRPRNAYQRTYPDAKAQRTSATGTVALPTAPSDTDRMRDQP